MVTKEEFKKWLKRGKQKQLVASLLVKPMTSQELYLKAFEKNPNIRIQDVRAILRKMGKLGFVRILNPAEVTGRLYIFVDGISERFIFDPAFDWNLYAWVIRGKARKAILEEIGRNGLEGVQPKSASEVKKNLKGKYSISLNFVIDTIKELLDKNLIYLSKIAPKRDTRLYAPTEKGNDILNEIHR